jgi:hypothetical protein
MDTGKFAYIRPKRWLDMKKSKKFDCVRMKWDAQQQIQKEFSGVSDDEAHKIQMARVIQSPILSPFCKKVFSAKGALTK